MALAVLAVIGGVIFGIGVRKPGVLLPGTPEYAAAFPDFVVHAEEPITPEENAYTYFTQAADAIVSLGNDEQGSPIRFITFLKENRTNLAVVAEVLADNEQVFQLVLQGVQCRRCVYPESKYYFEHFVGVKGIFDILPLFSAKIKYGQDRGDIESALQDIHTLLSYGRLMRQNTTFLYILMCTAIESHGVLRITELSRDPQLTERQLKRLLEILDETPSYADSLRNAFKFEFIVASKSLGMSASENHNTIVSDLLGVTPSDVTYFEKLVLRLKFLPGETQMQIADAYRTQIAKIEKNYADTIRPVAKKYNSGLKFKMIFEKNFIGNKCTYDLTCAADDMNVRHYRMDAEISAAKIIIASHLFLRETGRKPLALDELVPDFLPSVPSDPFDGAPFRYNPELGVIYTVGKSLTDYGGIVEYDDDVPESNRINPWRAKNTVFKIWEE